MSQYNYEFNTININTPKYMSQQELKDITTDFILTILGATTGIASTMDNVEQLGRILLLFVSIVSGCLLIAVNWEKGKAQFKKWFNGKH